MAGSTTAGMAGSSSETLRSIFVTALHNAHALEKQALQLMERQVERIQNYPEIEQALRRHIQETEGQRQRVEEALHSLGEDRSMLKDVAMQFMGNMAALAHTPAGDEILKNTFANHAFENFEIAAYKSLITITEATGHTQFIPGFQQSLREEEGFAGWLYDNVETITRKYLSFEERGEKADR